MGSAANFRGGPLFQDQFANLIRKRQEFAKCCTAVEPCLIALLTACTVVEGDVFPLLDLLFAYLRPPTYNKYKNNLINEMSLVCSKLHTILLYLYIFFRKDKVPEHPSSDGYVPKPLKPEELFAVIEWVAPAINPSPKK